MISLPVYLPLQWIIIEGEEAFAQIINAEEKEEGGWVYKVSTDGTDIKFVNEEDIPACLVDGKWTKKAIVTSLNVYS